MNLKQMIDKMLIVISKKHKVFFIEQRNYFDGKVFKTYKIKIDNNKLISFTTATKLINFLKEWS